MANLKEIRNRIASVSSTMQITSAMKMVSAAKLKKQGCNNSNATIFFNFNKTYSEFKWFS